MSKEFEEKVLKKLEQLDTLSEEQKNIVQKLDTLSEEFNQFREEQRDFNAKQKEFNAKQKEFNAKQEQLNKRILKRLDNIERNVLIIEDRVSNEIPALFDLEKTREQKQTRFETDLDSLDRKTENHSIRILALEHISEKHEEKFKNLVS